MKIVVIVPIKKNSKRVFNKNFREINGIPLYRYLLDKLKNSNFDEIFIDSDSDEIKEYSLKDSRIKLLKTDYNVGSGIARNIGIGNSNGRYISFLDSDDTWDVNKIEIQLNFMKTKNIAFSFTSYRIMYGNKITNSQIMQCK